jgi:hypothetical protein
MAEVAPSELSAAGLARIAALLRDVFPSARGIDPAYLDWGYTANPQGRAVAFDAHEADALVGHVAGRALVARIDGHEERGLLIHHAATRAGQRGRGWLGAGIEAVAAAGREAGFGFLLGVANAKSAPVFVGRYGFQGVGPLDVRLGLGLPPPFRGEHSVQLETRWSPPAIAWRLAQPGADYRVRRLGDAAQVLVRSGRAGPWLELAWLPVESVPPALPAPQPGPRLGAFIGLEPRRRARPWPALHVPLRLRPSPLELIFRDLAGRRRLDHARIAFCALDFDAY